MTVLAAALKLDTFEDRQAFLQQYKQKMNSELFTHELPFWCVPRVSV